MLIVVNQLRLHFNLHLSFPWPDYQARQVHSKALSLRSL